MARYLFHTRQSFWGSISAECSSQEALGSIHVLEIDRLMKRFEHSLWVWPTGLVPSLWEREAIVPGYQIYISVILI